MGILSSIFGSKKTGGRKHAKHGFYVLNFSNRRGHADRRLKGYHGPFSTKTGAERVARQERKLWHVQVARLTPSEFRRVWTAKGRNAGRVLATVGKTSRRDPGPNRRGSLVRRKIAEALSLSRRAAQLEKAHEWSRAEQKLTEAIVAYQDAQGNLTAKDATYYRLGKARISLEKRRMRVGNRVRPGTPFRHKATSERSLVRRKIAEALNLSRQAARLEKARQWRRAEQKLTEAIVAYQDAQGNLASKDATYYRLGKSRVALERRRFRAGNRVKSSSRRDVDACVTRCRAMHHPGRRMATYDPESD